MFKKTKHWMYSKTHNTCVLMPMKTASTHVSWVLKYFDFETYIRVFYDGDTHKDFVNSHVQPHDCYIPEELENPKTILTVRNPYERTLSFFLFMRNYLQNKNVLPSDFRYFLENLKNKNNDFEQLNFKINTPPTYIIRQENLYEDYCKIDFINESDLNHLGILQRMSNKKINNSNIEIKKDEFLDSENKSIIYGLFESHFLSFGYEK